MAQAIQQNKRLILSLDDIIQFQLITYCFEKSISLSDNELQCLTDLAKIGEIDLSYYCMEASEKKFFKSPQSVRNFLCKAEQLKLVNKVGTIKKKVCVNEEINLLCKGTIILNYQLIYASKES